MNDPLRVYPIVFRRLLTGMNLLYCTIGRIDRTVPPSPASSAPSVSCCPLCGEIPLSSVLNEKFGKILLVIIPLTAFGPEIPRNAMKSKRHLDAVLRAIKLDRSSE